MTTLMRIIITVQILQTFWKQLFPYFRGQLFPYVGNSYSLAYYSLLLGIVIPLIWETLCPLYILQEEAGYDNCDEDHHHAAVLCSNFTRHITLTFSASATQELVKKCRAFQGFRGFTWIFMLDLGIRPWPVFSYHHKALPIILQFRTQIL